MRPEDFRLTDSLKKTMRKKGWSVTFDQQFETVMRRCSEVPALAKMEPGSTTT